MKKFSKRGVFTSRRRRVNDKLREAWALAYDLGFEEGRTAERQESGRSTDHQRTP